MKEYNEENPEEYDYAHALKELEASMLRVQLLEGQIDTEITYGNSIRTDLKKYVNYKESIRESVEK